MPFPHPPPWPDHSNLGTDRRRTLKWSLKARASVWTTLIWLRIWSKVELLQNCNEPSGSVRSRIICWTSERPVTSQEGFNQFCGTKEDGEILTWGSRAPCKNSNPEPVECEGSRH
jgi:hypothetical protein